jgi:hypothetical protein
MKRNLYIPLFLFTLILTLTACTQKEPNTSPSDLSITLTSPSFGEGESIPLQFTCTGDNHSPELTWSNPPAGTQSFALIMDDPDAPVGTWVHWVLANLPAEERTLPEDYTPESGVTAGKNSAGSNSYAGPCPPSGQHRYFFKLYALDTVLEADASLDKSGLLGLMEGHVLGQGQLMGVYQQP